MNWPMPANAWSYLTICRGFDWAVGEDVPLTIGDTGDQNLVGKTIREYKIATTKTTPPTPGR